MRIYYLLAVALLAGCATTSHVASTSSAPQQHGGRLDVVTKATPAAARGKVTGAMTDLGFSLVSDTPSQAKFSRFGRQAVVAATWHYDVTFIFIEQSPGTRITANVSRWPFTPAVDWGSDRIEGVTEQVASILNGLPK